MHTITMIAGGFILLGVFAAAAYLLQGKSGDWPAAVVYFIPVWFVVALVNMFVGVYRAGYSFAAETPVFIIVFGVPAAAAFLARKLASR